MKKKIQSLKSSPYPHAIHQSHVPSIINEALFILKAQLCTSEDSLFTPKKDLHAQSPVARLQRVMIRPTSRLTGPSFAVGSAAE